MRKDFYLNYLNPLNWNKALDNEKSQIGIGSIYRNKAVARKKLQERVGEDLWIKNCIPTHYPISNDFTKFEYKINTVKVFIIYYQLNI